MIIAMRRLHDQAFKSIKNHKKIKHSSLTVPDGDYKFQFSLKGSRYATAPKPILYFIHCRHLHANGVQQSL